MVFVQVLHHLIFLQWFQCGCFRFQLHVETVSFKPSEKDPSCAIRLAELFSEAGLPDGVLNVINGEKEIVDETINFQRYFIN